MEKITVLEGKVLEIIEGIDDANLRNEMLALHWALQADHTAEEKLTLIEAQLANVMVFAGIKHH